jgi:hypothetical protein
VQKWILKKIVTTMNFGNIHEVHGENLKAQKGKIFLYRNILTIEN